MLKKFIEQKWKKCPQSPLQKLEQNYISAPYIQSKYVSRSHSKFQKQNKPFSGKTSQPLPMQKIISDKLRVQNDMMASIVFQEKEKRKKMESDIDLVRLAYQNLEDNNALLNKKIMTAEQIIRKTQAEKQNQAANLKNKAQAQQEEVIRIKLKQAKKNIANIAIQTENQDIGVGKRTKTQIWSQAIKTLEKENEQLRLEQARLQQTITSLERQLEETKSVIKRAQNRERHSIQNLQGLSEQMGIIDYKFKDFLIHSPITKEFEFGNVDATTSEVFREHILYLMYLSNSHLVLQEKKFSEIKQQLDLEIKMKEQFQNDLGICRKTFKRIRELIGREIEITALTRRDLLRLVESVDQHSN